MFYEEKNSTEFIQDHKILEMINSKNNIQMAEQNKRTFSLLVIIETLYQQHILGLNTLFTYSSHFDGMMDRPLSIAIL